jgi:hypothetical protein
LEASLVVVLTISGAADDGTGSPPAATLALAGMSIVTVLAMVSVAAGCGPAASIGASWETCRTPAAGEPAAPGAAALASLPFGVASFAVLGSIPGSVCRTASPITISPLVPSKRLNNTRSRRRPPTSSHGSQKL